MPLDPQAEALLKEVAASGLPPLESLTPGQARELTRQRRAQWAGDPLPVAAVEERCIQGPAGPVPLRLYKPAEAGPLPLLVYFHGGGWVNGDLDSSDVPCRAMAQGSSCLVASVNYRHAPEHKFPAAVEDGYAVLRHVAEHPREFSTAPGRIAVGGDSSGGNLAAAVTLMARDRGGPPIAFQLLIYPVTDHRFDTRSYHDNAEGYLLTRAGMAWFWNHYLESPADGDHPYASPLRAGDFRGLPAAWIATAEYDPLRDEGEAYAARLAQAGVPVAAKRYDGMIHGFLNMAGVLDQGRQLMEDAAAALRTAFAK